MIGRAAELFAENRGVAQQFAGYVLVSAAAFVVDLSIYYSLLGIARYAFLAAVCGFVFGVLTHYALSSRLVFRERFHSRGVVAEAPAVLKFFSAGMVGLVVTAVVVGVLADVYGFHPLLAKLVAAGCSFVAVFTLLRFFVFNAALPSHRAA